MHPIYLLVEMHVLGLFTKLSILRDLLISEEKNHSGLQVVHLVSCTLIIELYILLLCVPLRGFNQAST